jgi:hypothetical protein
LLHPLFQPIDKQYILGIRRFLLLQIHKNLPELPIGLPLIVPLDLNAGRNPFLSLNAVIIGYSYNGIVSAAFSIGMLSPFARSII